MAQQRLILLANSTNHPRQRNLNVVVSTRQGRPNKTLEVTRLSGHEERFGHSGVMAVATVVEPRPSA